MKTSAVTSDDKVGICCDSVDYIIHTANSKHVRFISGDRNIIMSCDHDRLALDDILDVYDMKDITVSSIC